MSAVNNPPPGRSPELYGKQRPHIPNGMSKWYKKAMVIATDIETS